MDNSLAKKNKHKERIYRKKLKQKPIQKIKNNLRKRIKEILGYKDISISKSLGCTPKEFRAYIESLFTPGMTWENYGKWHIDHKKPLSKFDLIKKEEREKANHYTNLQPLWAIDNIKKGNKYNMENFQ